MKKLSNYLLVVLCISAISFIFVNDSNAQTKKVTKKKTVAKKKPIKKKQVFVPGKFRIDPNVIPSSGSSSEEKNEIVMAGSGISNSISPTDTSSNSSSSSSSKTVSGGVINGKAVNLVKPEYPPAAKAVKASGAVNVQVTIDKEGNVISAAAISGHPLLYAACVNAARASKFSSTTLQGQKVKVTGVIVYNFIAQ